MNQSNSRSLWSARVFRRFGFLFSTGNFQCKNIQSAGIRRTPNASRVRLQPLSSNAPVWLRLCLTMSLRLASYFRSNERVIKLACLAERERCAHKKAIAPIPTNNTNPLIASLVPVVNRVSCTTPTVAASVGTLLFGPGEFAGVAASSVFEICSAFPAEVGASVT